MADLTSLYRNKPKRDYSIQACADCLNKIASQFPAEFKKGFFTDYFDISGGTQPPKSKFINEPKDGYIRFLQIRDFASDLTPTYIPIAKNNKLCSENDLLLGRYGASVGKILTGKAGAYNVACAKIVFLNENEVDKDFLFYWLHCSYFQNFLTSISRSAQGGFNKNDISRIETFFPSISTQRKLISILKMIDNGLLSDSKIDLIKESKDEIVFSFVELIEKFLSFINEGEELSTELTHQLDLVKKLRQQLLQDAVQGKLVPQVPNDESASELLKKIKAEKQKLIAEGKLKKDKELPPIKAEEIPFDIPNGWVWCKINELVFSAKEDIRTGPFGTALNKGEHKNEGIPVWGIESISKDGKFTNKNKIFVNKEKAVDLKSFGVKGGDLIISRSGTIGELCMIPYETQYGLLSTNLMKISVNQKVILPEYFCHIIKGGDFIKKMLFEFCSGSTRLFLTQNILDKLLFPLPPIVEQHRIVQKLDELMQTCEALEASIKESAEQNEKLLQQVLREALRKV